MPREVTDLAQLHVFQHAWDLVKPLDDVRGPVDCVVPLGCESFYRHVIVTMTATEPVMTFEGPHSVRLQAAGYRAGPAGP